MADYKGYDYTVEYDADYPGGMNWRFSIYKQFPDEYKCVFLDYTSTRNEAVKKAKEYIDMWEEHHNVRIKETTNRQNIHQENERSE